MVGALWWEPRHVALGGGIMALGEALRLWAVGHIGLPSRTREAGVGALVTQGPYGLCRNPLYVGNLVLWAGFGVVFWPAALGLVPLLMAYYAAIVRWEEAQLLAHLGSAWRAYADRVPRWLPRAWRVEPGWDPGRALRTERGTLVVLAAVALVVVLRAG